MADDPTVDLINPLGVTQVTYEPDLPRQKQIESDAAAKYEELTVLFEELTMSISAAMAEERAAFDAILESFTSQPDSAALESIIDTLKSAADEVVQTILSDIEQRTIFKPQF